MKILIFLHGTLIMHKSAEGKTREERVKQVLNNEESVHDYASYIPVGNSVEKLKAWQKQGAEILYLSSHENAKDVEKDRSALKKYNFPAGPVFFRKKGESYKEIAERIIPDLLIEDDCESIGGEKEMTITSVKPEIKQKIKSIVVKEFSGIDNLPDEPEELLKTKNKIMIKITYFVHGTTTDNEKDLATGWNPGKLSEKGIEQSKELGKLLKKDKFDAVFCSDLKRAVDSAKLVFGGKCKIVKDKRLMEADYGNLTGTDFSKFKNHLKDFIDKPFPNGESYKDVEKRVADFLEFLKKNYSSKHIAIVAHQGPQLALEVLINKKTWPQAIDEDWRNKEEWQPGWKYESKD